MLGVTRTILHAFPPPRYLSIPAVGLDISDESIKFVELKQTRCGLTLARFGEERIPFGVLVRGQIKKPQELARSLGRLREKYGLADVVASLPEEQAYVVKLRLPPLRRRELRGGVELQLEELVPLKVSESEFDFELLQEPVAREPHYDVSVSVLPKKSVTTYLEAFEAAGLSPLAFEIEGQALARALIPPGLAPQAVMIVDFGKRRTGIAIVLGGKLRFSATVEYGGVRLNEEIMNSFGVSEIEAEQMKRDARSVPAGRGGEFTELVTASLAVLADEMNKYKLFWVDHRDEGGEPREPLARVVLCGGSSNIADMTEIIGSAVGLETILADPWVNVGGARESVPALHAHEALRYATAIGLALRGTHYPQ